MDTAIFSQLILRRAIIRKIDKLKALPKDSLEYKENFKNLLKLTPAYLVQVDDRHVRDLLRDRYRSPLNFTFSPETNAQKISACIIHAIDEPKVCQSIKIVSGIGIAESTRNSLIALCKKDFGRHLNVSGRTYGNDFTLEFRST